MVIDMLKNQRFSLLLLAAASAVLPAKAQTRTTLVPAARPPYTVEFKVTDARTLPDGSTVATESKEVVARDRDGRSMQSTTAAPVGNHPAISTGRISNPATGDEITWSSATGVATDVKRPVGEARRGCWATADGKFRTSFGEVGGRSPVPAAGAKDGLPRPRPVANGQDAGNSGVEPGLGVPAREDLGANTILGVEVRGTRTTLTTPAGADGSGQPQVRTSEVWMAPSLGLALRAISIDPQMGRIDRQAVSVNLNAPEPALFRPPAGYKVETEVMQQVECGQ